MRPWSKKVEALYLKALTLEDKGDLRGAQRGFLALARTGEPTAQHALAHLLADKIKPARWDEARRWYKRAVKNGNPLSAWNLAIDYGNRKQPHWQKYWLQTYARMDKASAREESADWGNRLIARKRHLDALPYLELAARLGDVSAQNDCAIILETKVKPPRVREALIWYRKAVKRGSKEAAHNLSLHYRDGDDAAHRLQWLRIAAKTGHSEAKTELHQLERARRRV